MNNNIKDDNLIKDGKLWAYIVIKITNLATNFELCKNLSKLTETSHKDCFLNFDISRITMFFMKKKQKT